ncbi:glutathione S-transferase family protein [Lichenihabitans sp. PAMC28606]|uniref:glutathione S-transferase family protein n=1 Tax=Lichenihabitans sp. PAMC28606 TaxID=2880932 RepID=UPI001D09EB92|nr:glutathione S-transferase family protein [Lichenihabitans sp. PAMC28606]UDL94498.1 glutathione S-transferase family protein [Lichenihabitans sp. PAMC28606]
MTDKLVFFHAPQTRSTGVSILLDELAAPHELRLVNMKAGEQREASFLAVNPMGKVPAILHGDALVTEQVAIFTYLPDLFPQEGLAPAIGDPLRGPYLRWLAFYGSSFEPAIVDRAMKRDAGSIALCPYGTYDSMLSTLTDQLRGRPYLLGARMTAADILWAGALQWTTNFGLVPKLPEIEAYLERMTKRPSFEAATARDADIVAQQEAAVS